jgi:hypothetical protein
MNSTMNTTVTHEISDSEGTDTDHAMETSQTTETVTKTQVASRAKAVKKDSGIVKKKKACVPRATPRPYRNLTMERLSASIDTLRERVEVADNRLQTYNIRLRKLNVEMETRKKGVV